MSLDRSRLRDYHCERIRNGATATESEVAAYVSAELSAARKSSAGESA
jgi:hypothetical protein